MKLYYAKGSCSLVVRITLHEMQLDCEFEAVNLKTKQLANGENFLNINPKGSVPVLMIDNQQIITENSVILQYLADTHHRDELLPPVDQLERYRVLEWLNYISTEIHKSFGPLFNSNLNAELKENFFIPILRNKLNYLAKHLEQRSYLTNKFSLADPYTFVMLFWLKHFNISLSNWPSLENYYEKLIQRKSIQQALNEEELIEEIKIH
jgi:glutathione S-transferase